MKKTLSTITSEHKDFKQVLIYVPLAHPLDDDDDDDDGDDDDNDTSWTDLDQALAKLWGLYKTCVKFILTGGVNYYKVTEEQNCALLEKLLPRVTMMMKKDGIRFEFGHNMRSELPPFSSGSKWLQNYSGS